MQKTQTILLISAAFLFASSTCKQAKQTNNADKIKIKTDNYVTGDCLEFREHIKDFGVIFLKESNFPEGKQFDIFPIKLDTTKSGIDKFKFGRVYISSYPDLTKQNNLTEGFAVYHFLEQKDFEQINKFFINVGTLNIRDKYRNTTGGTTASTFEEFKTQLKIWDKLFGYEGRLVPVNEILDK